MTDEFPRPGGGDGDGPAETPTERLLREAMNARTSLITAHDLRPADPPKGRLRRLRPLYLTTVPILALAASLAIGVLTLHGTPVAKQDVPPPPAAGVSESPSPTATPSATAAASPTADTAPTEAPETDAPLADDTPASPATTTTINTPAGSAGTPYTFRGVKLRIPAGWRVASADPASYHLCVLSPGAAQGAGAADCRPYGVDLTVFDAESDSWPAVADLDAGSGWGHQPYCPVWGNPHSPVGDELSSSGPVKSTPTVAGRAARKSQWQVTCGSSTSTVQIWALPKDQVFVSAAGLKDDYQAGLQSIVNSLDVSGHQPPPTAANKNDIAVSYDGLADGQQLTAGGPVVTFSVTYRNTSQNTYSRLEPLVITDVYPGSVPSDFVAPSNDGKLERLDGSTWTEKGLSPGTDMGYAVADPGSVFSLSPGQSRKVTYRMTLGAKNGPGRMPVKAQVMLPYSGSTMTLLGEKDITVNVTK
ncbi:hypothetical protein ACFWIQ_09360 [Kitasatospora sp. NPDC127059]|uniref:hypothetical protein n=1 Tax=unclassified Kitasatospora TaxID=2633591 RepID=UPI0036622487